MPQNDGCRGAAAGELLYSAARAGAALTSKGEQTRARILGTALELFLERGYEETTMRTIAREAKVSLGNAYYYFESKEHLIQAFYARTHEQHLAACGELLEREAALQQRLAGVLRAKIDTLRPYHRFAGQLFKTAADPASPLNPFSDDSQRVRRESTALFAAVLSGSSVRVHESLMKELPELLWLYHMGVILYWIHDGSPGCARTYRLAEGTVEIVARSISLANLPPLRSLTRRALELLAALREGEATPAPAGVRPGDGRG